jgi:DNA-binding IclR family transcriptional regulator
VTEDVEEEKSADRRRGIQSIELGMRVLEAMAAQGVPTPLGVLAHATGMAAPQVHRYLHSLMAAGMARQDPATGRYDLGPAALRIGLAALSRTDAFRMVDRQIGDFVERTGQAVQICAFGPVGPTIVRIYNGRPALLTSLQVGSVLPLALSATGRVFLGFMPLSETRELVAREGAVNVAGLVEIAAQVRREGSAGEASSVVPGLKATAFPVLDLQGRAILVATAIMPESATGREDGVAELGELCRQISTDLGWLPDKR